MPVIRYSMNDGAEVRHRSWVKYVLIIAIGAIVAIAIEVIVCYSGRLPATIDERDLQTRSRAVSALGSPSLEIVMLARNVSRTLFGVQMPSVLPVAPNERLTVTLWEHRCYLPAFQRLIVVSRADGKIIFVGGASHMFFPIVIRRFGAASVSFDPVAPALRPLEFVVPAGARNIREFAQAGASGVAYEAMLSSAEGLINSMAIRAAAHGWRPLRESVLNPGIPSDYVRGWEDFEDISRRPAVRVRQWVAEWRNMKGDVLSYSLRSESSTPAPSLPSSIEVSALVTPARLINPVIARVVSPARVEQLKSLEIAPGIDPNARYKSP